MKQKIELPSPPETAERMTEEELRDALHRLGVSQAWLAAWMDAERQQVGRWVRGAWPVPKWMRFVIYLLERERARLEAERPGDPLGLEIELPAPRRAGVAG